MENNRSVKLSGSSVETFGTMDGFSLVNWALEIENASDADVACLISFDFVDKRGIAIGDSRRWKWFCHAYSPKKCGPAHRGRRYVIRANSVRKISGLVKTAAEEAGRFADIRCRIEPEAAPPAKRSKMPVR